MKTSPKVTIGIIGCNRLHYFRALIESARECIQYDNLEWIVYDNASVEAGMSKYLKTLKFVDDLIVRKERNPATEHISAMNEIVNKATGEYIIFMPDDMQFVLKGEWLHDFVELAETNARVGSVVLNAQRHTTLKKFFQHSMIDRILRPAQQTKYQTDSGRQFVGYGNTKAGINPAAIGTITKTSIWRELGDWTSSGAQSQQDSTGGGEDGMLIRYWKSGMDLDRILPAITPSVSIFAGPRNDQAYVRGNRRYAEYMAPPEGKYYYSILEEKDVSQWNTIYPSLAYEKLAVPIGFEQRMDDIENMYPWKKRPDDKFGWIHPSVEGLEIS
jgi:glycosyltransferase involved in cell wall biosynthesis